MNLNGFLIHPSNQNIFRNSHRPVTIVPAMTAHPKINPQIRQSLPILPMVQPGSLYWVLFILTIPPSIRKPPPKSRQIRPLINHQPPIKREMLRHAGPKPIHAVAFRVFTKQMRQAEINNFKWFAAALRAWFHTAPFIYWSGRKDLNLQLPDPRSGGLPDCPTPRKKLMVADNLSSITFNIF